MGNILKKTDEFFLSKTSLSTAIDNVQSFATCFLYDLFYQCYFEVMTFTCDKIHQQLGATKLQASLLSSFFRK